VRGCCQSPKYVRITEIPPDTSRNKLKISMKSIGPESIVFRGDFFEIVHQDFAETTGIKSFEFARRGPGTRIITVRGDAHVLLTREFRRETGGYDIRLPGGKVFDSLVDYQVARTSTRPLSDFANEAATRELEEETGYKASQLSLLSISKCGATIEWDLYYFLCETWAPPDASFNPSGDEDITVVWTPFAGALEMCVDGTISEERSAVNILRYLRGRRGAEASERHNHKS
jgi:8-oxo-dGTP pyrophosphatase MutT (NUDIX family)